MIIHMSSRPSSAASNTSQRALFRILRHKIAEDEKLQIEIETMRREVANPLNASKLSRIKI